MPYRIEDGMGSRNRATIFEKRMRTFDVESSLMNHLTQDILEKVDPSPPTIGVFEARAVTSVAVSGTSLIYIANTAPDTVIIVDRIFTNTFISDATLPNADVYIKIIMDSKFTVGTGTPITADNTNQSMVNIQPDIVLLNNATTSGGVESSRKYVRIARTHFIEPIVQKSDGILLGKGNSLEIFLATNASTSIEAYMTFAIVNPDDLGLSHVGIR